MTAASSIRSLVPAPVQSPLAGDDAVMAAKAGAAAVILSNHGGRNCDTSR